MSPRALAASLLLAITPLACAGSPWTEPPTDAGSSIATATRFNGVGPLGTITGVLDGSSSDYEDIYEILILEPESFRARTFSTSEGGGAAFDTRLFLFDSSGRGVLANDDFAPGESGSQLTNMADDGTGAGVPFPGVYFLAVSGASNEPQAGFGPQFSFATPYEISGPDGPGGAFFLSFWSPPAETGEYTIHLEGCIVVSRARPGLVEHFSHGLVNGWQGAPPGDALLDNPGSGGADGVDDGYLRVTQPGSLALVAADFHNVYAANYLTNGVGGFLVSLNDVNTDEAFEIHFGLTAPTASGLTTWVCNAPLMPAHNAWTTHFVRLQPLNEAQWTRVGGSATFEESLSSASRPFFWHDRAPLTNNPEPITGDLGIDRITLLPICPGDTNGDNVVNFLDLNNVLSTFGQSGMGLSGDVNNDGEVTFPDLNSVLSFFTEACPVE